MRRLALAFGLLGGAAFGAAAADQVTPSFVAPPASSGSAELLLARHAALRARLDDNPFQRPLVLESSAPKGGLQGEVVARIDQPFAVVSTALRSRAHWCDILILHLNVKGCRSSLPPAADSITLFLGRKTDQALADAERVEFSFVRAATAPGYLSVALAAASGPLGTSDYRIALEATALDAERSVIHLTYSYAYGTAAGWAMKGYLATSGRDKVGFGIVGHDAAGAPVLQRGVRGVVERNTMRYFLAIDAYLGALATPADRQVAKRLDDWHSSTERYPRQLHELGRADYLAMKQREIARQAGFGAAPAGE